MTTDFSSRDTAQDQSITVIRQRLHEAVPYLRTRHAVEQLWLFGSRVRCEEGTDSDLDVLVEFGEIPTIRDADTILVMDHGRIVEQGAHDDLLARRGFYYELYNSQFAEALAEAS